MAGHTVDLHSWLMKEHKEPWRLETPRTVRNMLRQNPLVAAFNYVGICALAYGVFAADNALRWPPLFAALVGVPLGTFVWWLLMYGTARGWIENE
jgi:hypothetical protein